MSPPSPSLLETSTPPLDTPEPLLETSSRLVEPFTRLPEAGGTYRGCSGYTAPEVKAIAGLMFTGWYGLLNFLSQHCLEAGSHAHTVRLACVVSITLQNIGVQRSGLRVAGRGLQRAEGGV